MVIVVIRGVTSVGQGGSNFPGAGPLWGRRMAAGGAEKSQQCHKYFLQRRTFACKDLRLEHGGAKLASCPGRHLTSLCPWWLRKTCLSWVLASRFNVMLFSFVRNAST